MHTDVERLVRSARALRLNLTRRGALLPPLALTLTLTLTPTLAPTPALSLALTLTLAPTKARCCHASLFQQGCRATAHRL